jgi:hypothetical protein
MKREFLVATLLLSAVPLHAAPTKPAHAEVLPWIADDYPKALARAKSLNIPMFVEAWATW